MATRLVRIKEKDEEYFPFSFKSDSPEYSQNLPLRFRKKRKKKKEKLKFLRLEPNGNTTEAVEKSLTNVMSEDLHENKYEKFRRKKIHAKAAVETRTKPALKEKPNRLPITRNTSVHPQVIKEVLYANKHTSARLKETNLFLAKPIDTELKMTSSTLNIQSKSVLPIIRTQSKMTSPSESQTIKSVSAVEAHSKTVLKQKSTAQLTIRYTSVHPHSMKEKMFRNRQKNFRHRSMHIPYLKSKFRVQPKTTLKNRLTTNLIARNESTPPNLYKRKFSTFIYSSLPNLLNSTTRGLSNKLEESVYNSSALENSTTEVYVTANMSSDGGKWTVKRNERNNEDRPDLKSKTMLGIYHNAVDSLGNFFSNSPSNNIVIIIASSTVLLVVLIVIVLLVFRKFRSRRKEEGVEYVLARSDDSYSSDSSSTSCRRSKGIKGKSLSNKRTKSKINSKNSRNANTSKSYKNKRKAKNKNFSIASDSGSEDEPKCFKTKTSPSGNSWFPKEYRESLEKKNDVDLQSTNILRPTKSENPCSRLSRLHRNLSKRTDKVYINNVLKRTELPTIYDSGEELDFKKESPTNKKDSSTAPSLSSQQVDEKNNDYFSRELVSKDLKKTCSDGEYRKSGINLSAAVDNSIDASNPFCETFWNTE